MTCISPFDNGSYHMGTIRTNRTNRHLGQGAHGIQRLRNILSPPNDMHFSIRQRVVSRNVLLVRIDDSIASAQLFYDSYLFRCIGQPSRIMAMINPLLRVSLAFLRAVIAFSALIKYFVTVSFIPISSDINSV